MPYSQAAHNFFGLCASRKGRKKARMKCPSLAVAKKMLKEGVKKK
jgi:hypothetical protein